MLGARSMFETAVGSRPKWNTTSTSTTKTATERTAVRERSSTKRSFEAMAQACRTRLGDRMAILLRYLPGIAARPRREMDEPAGAHEREIGRESRPLFHVVRDEDRGSARRGVLRHQSAQGFGGNTIESCEGLVEQEHGR